MNKPTVSVIMSCYNSSEYIETSVYSVLNQTYDQWELIIIDDCSTDNSYEKIENFTKIDKRIKCIKTEINSGPACRNIAIKEATGRYIAFLDSDDIWYRDKLEKQVCLMEENRLLASCTYAWACTIQDNRIEICKLLRSPKNITPWYLELCNFVSSPTPMYNQEVLGKIYMPNLRKRQDYALWKDIAGRVGSIRCIEIPLAIYRKGNKNSVSGNKLKSMYASFQLLRSVEKCQLIPAVVKTIRLGLFSYLRNKDQIHYLFSEISSAKIKYKEI